MIYIQTMAIVRILKLALMSLSDPLRARSGAGADPAGGLAVPAGCGVCENSGGEEMAGGRSSVYNRGARSRECGVQFPSQGGEGEGEGAVAVRVRVRVRWQ
jgi:hypothetical protein